MEYVYNQRPHQHYGNRTNNRGIWLEMAYRNHIQKFKEQLRSPQNNEQLQGEKPHKARNFNVLIAIVYDYDILEKTQRIS